jgi:hypothetical protein
VAERFGIAGLALVALALRLWGINFGLPAVYRPDENILVGRAMGNLHGVLNPHYADWPHLYMYLSAAWLWLLRPVFPLAADGSPYLAVRVLDALIGTATVVLVYVLGRRAYGRAAATVGAAALAVAFLHVRDSHFATVDVPLTFATTAVLYFACRFAEDGRAWRGAIAAVWLGLAASVKYNGALAAAAIAAAQRVAPAPSSRPPTLTLPHKGGGKYWLAAFGLIAVLVFAITSPFLFIDFNLFQSGVRYIFGRVFMDLAAEVGWLRILRLSLWYGLDPPLFGLCIAGAAYALYRRTRADWVLLAFLAVYFGLMGAGHAVFARYAEPLLPVLCLLGGRLLVEVAARVTGRVRPALVVGLGIVLMAFPALLHDLAFDTLIQKTDTRTLAFDWLKANVPEGARVAELYFAGPSHDQATSLDERFRHGANDPYVSSFHQNRLQERYSVHLLTDQEIGTDSMEALKADGVNYVVYSAPTPGDGCANPTPLQQALTAGGSLLVTFLPTDGVCTGAVFDSIDAYYVPLSGYSGWVRPGPPIRIYRIG